MNEELLEDILQCPTLPSLPAIALEVIRLTGDPDVSMSELAKTIQNDAALASKVLRTVNSSFFGLSKRCASIEKAIILLGLSPVKTLTLGFSLVSSVDMEKEPRFPYETFWRRSLFAAVGARSVAEAAGLQVGDEAFLAALLQDIGMVAMLEAIGDPYTDVVLEAGSDHGKLNRLETEKFELQHALVSGMLAERWRLPEELFIPIRYHERPTAAPKEVSEVARCVGLGNMIHDILTDEDPLPARRRFYERALSWFAISETDADEPLKRSAEATKEMAQMFSLDVGDFKDPEEVERQAADLNVELIAESPRQSFAASQMEDLISDEKNTDPLTGILSKMGFVRALDETFTICKSEQAPMGAIMATTHGVPKVAKDHGIFAADDILMTAVAMMQRNFEPLGGILGRISDQTLAVLLPKAERTEVVCAAERFKSDFAKVSPPSLGKSVGELGVTITLGISCVERDTIRTYTKPAALLADATRAVKAAYADGGNCIRSYPIERAA